MDIGKPRRTHTVEPLEDPAPRERPEESHRRKGVVSWQRPDYVEPIVGWRGWFVVEAEDAVRLCSIVYHTLWPPRQELVASCRSRQHRLGPETPVQHSAPAADCRCGIYACESAATATSFLNRSRTPARQTLGFVLGRVSLWGQVVECQRGWRGERAYPSSIYFPRLSTEGRLLLARRPGPETVALALRSYGVPVESIACGSVTELARVLAGVQVQASAPTVRLAGGKMRRNAFEHGRREH